MEEQITTSVAEGLTFVQTLINTLIELGVNYGFSVFGAVIILIIGFFVGSQLAGWIGRVLAKKNFDVTLAKFLSGLVRIIVIAFAVIIALGKFGITITPFVAALGGMAFGASLAFQGPLSNYGAGLVIIMSRPFKVGDTIAIKGINGIVEDIKLSMTILTDEDGVKITIPNKHIVGEVLENSASNRIVNTTIGISYSSDADKAIEVIRNTVTSFSDVSSESTPQIGISEFADSSVNIGLRYWVPTSKYYNTLYQINNAIYKALGEANINIPFPQRDVRVISSDLPSLSQT